MNGNKNQYYTDEDFHFIEEVKDSFTRSIHEVLNDDAFELVRQEYEKLHQAMLRAHYQNLALVNRINGLNDEIQNNANKIATVLVLSQEDNKIIAALRKKFEKAWQIVEIAEENRTKSQDVIYTLKEKAANLRFLVDQETDFSHPEFSLQNTMKAIEKVQNNIKTNSEQIKAMNNQMNSMKQNTSQIQKENVEQAKIEKELNEEICTCDSLLEDFETQKENAIEVAANGNDEIANQKEMILLLKRKQTEKLENIEKLKLDLRNENRMIEAITDNTNLIYRKQQKKLKELPKYQKLTELTQKRCDYAKEQLDYADERYLDTQQKEKKLSRELDETRKLHQLVHEYKQNIAKQQQIVSSESKSKEQQLKLIKSKVTKSNLMIREDRNDVSVSHLELDDIQKEKEKEELETKIAVKGVEMANRECIDIKQLSSAQKITHEKVENDVLKNEQDKINFNISIEIDKNSYQQNQQMIDDLSISLTEINDQINQQNNWSDLLTSDRDSIVRTLQKLIQINEEKKEENKYLSKDIDKLQGDIRSIDTELIDMHVKTQEIQEYNSKTSEKIKEINSNKNSTIKQTELINHEIEKHAAIEREAQVDISMKNKLIKEIAIQNKHIEENLTKKKIENGMLFEKVKLMEIELKDFEEKFNDKVNETEQLKIKLKKSIQIRNNYLIKIKNLQNFKNEVNVMDKKILQANTESKILEEELENPRLLHRYTLMEATNPDLLLLIHTHEDIVDQIWKLISIGDKTAQEKTELIKNLNRKTIHLQQCKTADSISAEIESMQKTIERKNQQLLLMKEKLNEKRPITNNEGQLVDSMKSKIGNCKVDILNTNDRAKKPTSEINSKKEPTFDEIEYFDFKSVSFTTQPPKTASVKLKRNDQINTDFEFNRNIQITEPDSTSARRNMARTKNKHIIGGGFVMKNELSKSLVNKISNFNYQNENSTSKRFERFSSPRKKATIVLPITTDRRSNRTQNNQHSKSNASTHRMTLRSDRVPIDDL